MITLDKDWLIAAGKRAIKTMAQTALSMITIGMTVGEVDWKTAASVSVVAGVYSLLTSLKGLPETPTDGKLLIDTSWEEKDLYRFEIDRDIFSFRDQEKIVLKVVPNATLPRDSHSL